MGTSSDALANTLGQTSLDDHIRESNNSAKATDQRGRAICWAHATAHLASHRVVERNVEESSNIRSHLLTIFGDKDDRQILGDLLSQVCPTYRLL